MITQPVDINDMPFGFMIGHGIVDAIITLTQFWEEYLFTKRDLPVTFVDFEVLSKEQRGF